MRNFSRAGGVGTRASGSEGNREGSEGAHIGGWIHMGPWDHSLRRSLNLVGNGCAAIQADSFGRRLYAAPGIRHAGFALAAAKATV